MVFAIGNWLVSSGNEGNWSPDKLFGMKVGRWGIYRNRYLKKTLLLDRRIWTKFRCSGEKWSKSSNQSLQWKAWSAKLNFSSGNLTQSKAAPEACSGSKINYRTNMRLILERWAGLLVQFTHGAHNKSFKLGLVMSQLDSKLALSLQSDYYYS